MSYYLQLLGVQTPFSLGPDKNNRELYSCNYDAERYDSDSTMEADLSALISGAAIVPVSHIRLGTKPVLPPPTAAAAQGTEADGPFVRIISTGGYASNINRSSIRAERPSCQVLVASLDSQLASLKAWQIYRLLDGKRHTET